MKDLIHVSCMCYKLGCTDVLNMSILSYMCKVLNAFFFFSSEGEGGATAT